MPYIAAIDIGSNAVRLAIANHTHSGVYVSYLSRQPVRLGSSVFSMGSVNGETYSELKGALLEFRNQMENYNVASWRAVATSAMREATNSKSIVDRLRRETGLAIEIISGQEEARLVSLGISKKLDLSQGRYLLIDIGGGSIELVAVVNGKIMKKKSYKIGVVRILELHRKKGGEFEDWLPKFVEDEVCGFFDEISSLKNAVGTGGNMDRFIKLKSFVSNESEMFLMAGEMEKMSEMLSQVNYKERIVKFCLKSDRADVIVPAALITNRIMALAGSVKLHLPQVGLKDGLLCELSRNS